MSTDCDNNRLCGNRRRSAGMRTSERYERASAAIIEAALARFERDGVAATRLADISRDVHITRELIYYYFKNKQALCEAIADTYASRIASVLAEVSLDTTSFRELVATIRGLAYDERGHRTSMFRVLDEMGVTRRTLWDACLLAAGSDAPRLAFFVYGTLDLLEMDSQLDLSDIAFVIS